MAGAAVAATGPWRVLAQAEDDSTYYSYASANVSVNRPKAIRLRAFGVEPELGGYFSCDLPDTTVRSGGSIVLSIGKAKSCRISASVTSEEGGKVRVLIEGQR
jgi:hypothetical protein